MMFFFYTLWSIARYETITLLRSWFFRIFASLALVILFFMDLGLFTGISDAPWIFRGLPSAIPYMNIILLNIAQAIIAVFLASEFLKRDHKLDTTEVVYMRSMTNAEYVLGKTLGIILVFFILNLVILLMVAIINSVSPDLPIRWPVYFYYPIFICLPTLIFIFGLAFILMVLIRNQAVTFILLLGYIGSTLFFLGNKWHHIFDYMAFYFPMIYSDFVGFSNWEQIFLQRGMYLFLGLGFILFTVVKLKRLPQSRHSVRLSILLSIGFILTALWMGEKYYQYFLAGEHLRGEMAAVNAETIGQPRVSITDCELTVSHVGTEISVQAVLKLQNNTPQAIPAYHFSLNPGLQVDRITTRHNDTSFKRRQHVLTVLPGQSLAPNRVDSLTITYHGRIDDRACYPDIDEKSHSRRFHFWLYNVSKNHSFITPEFVLLTPENLWYPVAGVPYGVTYPRLPGKDFIHFKLNVRTRNHLTVIAQGQLIASPTGTFHFDSELPIPAMTLVIGKYDQRAITVDSIQYRMYTLEQHDYFLKYFNEISDTLGALIRELKNNYESKLNMEYPFKRLILTEVPIQFTCYKRIWTNSLEAVQPELILVSENGALMPGADFRRMSRRLKQRSERNNQTTTPREDQSHFFRQFVRLSLLKDLPDREDYEDIASYIPHFSILPNYYNFIHHFSSGRWPIFNLALETFFEESIKSTSTPRFQFPWGLSEDEKACLVLNGKSMAEILAQKDQYLELLPNVLRLKSNQLFKSLQSELGSEAFQKNLFTILQQHRFNETHIDDFLASVRREFSFDLESFLDTWYREQRLPGFIVADVRSYKVMDKDRTRFQVRFKIANPEPVTGLISVGFREEGERRRFFDSRSEDDSRQRYFQLPVGATREIGIILEEMPRIMEINTQISQNIPAKITHEFENWDLQEKAVPFDGEQIPAQPIAISSDDEWIVDNESPGFKVLYQPKESPLKRLLPGWGKKQDRYTGLRFWRPPGQWRLTTHSDFYGKFIHSAYYIKSGLGNKSVSWMQELPESGQYEVHAFAAKISNPWRQRGRRRDQALEQQHFLIYHDDGVEDTILDIPNAEAGWNYLGTYYFSQGMARIELTDQSKGQIVIADAIKWVKR